MKKPRISHSTFRTLCFVTGFFVVVGVLVYILADSAEYTSEDFSAYLNDEWESSVYSFEDGGCFELRTDENGVVRQVIYFRIADNASTSVALLEFDAQGNETHEVRKGSSTTEYRYTYNDTGQMLTEEYLRNGERESYTERTYDEEGNLLSWKEEEDGEQTVTTYTYGTNSWTATSRREGVLEWERTILYDDAGLAISSDEWNGDGVLIEHIEYDDAGNEISCDQWDEEGVLTERSETTYDDAGRVISYDQLDGNGVFTFRTEYSYDDAGRSDCCTDTYYEDGAAYYVTKSYTYYDEAGRIASSEYYQNDRRVDYWTYEYDDSGNEIRRVHITSYENYEEKTYVTETTYCGGEIYVRMTYCDGELESVERCYGKYLSIDPTGI